MEPEIPYRKVMLPPRQRLSDSIAAQIEELIVAGRLRPGDALPPERLLAQRFAVSRPSLREALLKLEARGLIVLQRPGGFQVSDISARSITDPLAHLLKRHPRAETDVLEMRHGLETVAAQFAAERATAEDRARLRRAYSTMLRMRAKGDTLADAEADADFHLAITEASHNVALIHVMRGIHGLLRASMRHAWDVMYAEPHSVRALHGQHRALLDAVVGGDPGRARQAAQLHLEYVRQSLEQRRSNRRRISARSRQDARGPES
jgi:GntR family transcriptional repressor for pyruvate dehydrogenase complex